MQPQCVVELLVHVFDVTLIRSSYHSLVRMDVMKAKVLLLHHNFPAQFRFVALDLAQGGHEVVFLTERNLVGDLPGIRQINVAGSKLQGKHQSGLDSQLDCAARFRAAMKDIRDGGWCPDLVISHSGWGCGMDVSWVFPEARRISYLEWWFANDAEEYTFDPGNPWWDYNPKKCLSLRHRNLSLALELGEAHHIVVPTRWQQSQLPPAIARRCEVIHEGVDTNFFVMNPDWRPKRRLRLTYATRGMEPMRGFPEFVQSLPTLLDRYPSLEVVIAGEDRVAYGSRLPEEGSFGRWAQRLLKPWIDAGSVRFVGQLSIRAYARLLKSSHVHCYLTRPFVASWSLLEAMSSGCCLVCSDLDVVREMAHPKATTWVDQRNQELLISGLDQALSFDSEERTARGKLQRQKAVQTWSRELSLQSWRGLLGI